MALDFLFFYSLCVLFRCFQTNACILQCNFALIDKSLGRHRGFLHQPALKHFRQCIRNGTQLKSLRFFRRKSILDLIRNGLKQKFSKVFRKGALTFNRQYFSVEMAIGVKYWQRICILYHVFCDARYFSSIATLMNSESKIQFTRSCLSLK